jgi:hypothetical protein
MSDSSLKSNDSILIYQILGYFASLKSSVSAEDSERLAGVVSTLESIFKISTTSPADFENFSYLPVTLPQIVEKGTQALNPLTYKANLAEVESNPKFNSFVAMVSDKGYYDGVEEGSIEYMQRHAKLIQKFKEKVGDNTPGSAGYLGENDLRSSKCVLQTN